MKYKDFKDYKIYMIVCTTPTTPPTPTTLPPPVVKKLENVNAVALENAVACIKDIYN